MPVLKNSRWRICSGLAINLPWIRLFVLYCYAFTLPPPRLQTRYIFHMLMARYDLFVLKVLLNANQPSSVRKYWPNHVAEFSPR